LDLQLPDKAPWSAPFATRTGQHYAEFASSLYDQLTLTQRQAVAKLHYTQSLYTKPRTYTDATQGLQRADYQVGDYVMVHMPIQPAQDTKKFCRMWRGPFVIQAKVSDLVYEVARIPGGARLHPRQSPTQHISHLKPTRLS
jgi:hypothetical protein